VLRMEDSSEKVTEKFGFLFLKNKFVTKMKP
jgi:hypothetical protein